MLAQSLRHLNRKTAGRAAQEASEMCVAT
jgi:hypothetical protein